MTGDLCPRCGQPRALTFTEHGWRCDVCVERIERDARQQSERVLLGPWQQRRRRA